MKIYRYGQDDLTEVFSRSQFNDERRSTAVAEIIKTVRERGDEALFSYTEKFDGIPMDANKIAITEEEYKKAYEQVSPEMLNTLRRAIQNVSEYHRDHLTKGHLKEENGRVTGQLIRPVKRAGVYVPGGTAPYPSSVLMTVLPAKAAGVEKIYMCSPNPRNPLTLVAAKECGVAKVFRVGGAQAIAAMAYGTESIPRVDVIAGPGNAYVATAKKMVYGDVKIDMIAGPSEILVITDGTARPEVLAADLLSQAEHDVMAASILVCTDMETAKAVAEELDKQTALLERRAIVEKSLKDNGAIIVADSLEQGTEIANRIAPEHLELQVKDPDALLPLIYNAGAVFAGYHSPEPLGDYFAGPSHVLPTSGTARYAEVLNADTFVRKMSYIRYSEEALEQAGEDIFRLATAEGFGAHARTVSVRFPHIGKENER